VPGDPSAVRDALEDARSAFLARRPQSSFEAHLDPDDPEATQLRKACRLIEACRTLRANDGFHTSVIEMSFAAIERTLEFYVLAQSNDTVEDFQDHAYAFDRAAALGLFSEATCDGLYQLHVDNRSAAYYRDTVATREQADAMFALAVEVHAFTTAFLQREHECHCSG
jgi:hypothetical protein